MTNNEIIKIVTERVIKKLKEYNDFKIPVGVSNRHVHVSQEDLEVLFGKGYELTKKSVLKQPGQYASNETVTIRGPKGEFERVRILGPVRAKSQVEISKTDSFRLGIKPPIRESGKLDGTPGIEIIGPKGKIVLSYGAIIAFRHIHMTPEQALAMGLRDNEIVDVETFGERKGIFGDVLVRVSDKSALEMHVDVDEANAFSLNNNDYVVIKHDNNQERGSICS
ncbi:phosphate propanoyltransferase [Clostridium cadaveris]|uniref:phosphate propanoyltransferase n=1 Tax=Clostridium cadaveris TaxID=1529 RepID=UPI0004147DC0|nr:phosphate propanoyltransferase [Clostridium cadaveris]MDY4949165.1 phosphate propanoyltransferase [Clostridium cadaveris]NME63364.1 phosphate propanoyltransferase [Clostridium cadaveris]